MKTKESNCCNTSETTCCSTEQKQLTKTNKTIGLGTLVLGVSFATASAFGTDGTIEKSNCSVNQENCEFPCEVECVDTSCCEAL